MASVTLKRKCKNQPLEEVLSRALQFCYGVHEDDNSMDAAETSSKAARSCYMQDFKEICVFHTLMSTVACIGSKT